MSYIRGVIGLATSDNCLDWNYEGVVINDPNYHFAFPRVYKYNNEYYMIPDKGGGSDKVQVYKATNFPGSWVAETHNWIQVDGYPIDPTIMRYNYRYWMFYTTGDKPHNCNLYSADDFLGPYTKHPHSPIVTSDKNGRPGGAAFTYGGMTPIRIAMDCDGDYGKRILGYEIQTLTTTNYSERPLSPEQILPPLSGTQWYMHHYDPWHIGGGVWAIATDRHINHSQPYEIWIYQSTPERW